MLVLDDISVNEGIKNLDNAILFLKHYFDVESLVIFREQLNKTRPTNYLHGNDDVIVLSNREKGKVRSRLKKIVIGHYIGGNYDAKRHGKPYESYRRKCEKLKEQCENTILPDELVFAWIKLGRRHADKYGKGYVLRGDLEIALNDHLKTLFLNQFIQQHETH